MTTHHVEPTVDTLHYDFSRDRKPILEIDSGDTVVFRTLDAGAHIEPWDGQSDPVRMEDAGPGHALCGPISVRDARPGQTLEIEIVDIRTGPWGTTGGGGYASKVNERVGVADGPMTWLAWTLDPDAGTACNQYGHVVDLRPFMGVIGLPPDEPGEHPTGPPRFCGGNLDCKELVAGSKLYLPITVPGALFSIGDGHGRQGDGEISGMAIECPMDRLEVKLTVLDEPVLKMPRAQTPSGWITFGLHENIEEAIHQAIDEMLDFLKERGFERKIAIAIASVVVDVRVTQLVNGVVGAHAILPPEAYR